MRKLRLYNSCRERADLQHTVQVMADLGLTYVQTKNIDGTYQYQIEPDISFLFNFKGILFGWFAYKCNTHTQSLLDSYALNGNKTLVFVRPVCTNCSKSTVQRINIFEYADHSARSGARSYATSYTDSGTTKSTAIQETVRTETTKSFTKTNNQNRKSGPQNKGLGMWICVFPSHLHSRSERFGRDKFYSERIRGVNTAQFYESDNSALSLVAIVRNLCVCVLEIQLKTKNTSCQLISSIRGLLHKNYGCDTHIMGLLKISIKWLQN